MYCQCLKERHVLKRQSTFNTWKNTSNVSEEILLLPTEKWGFIEYILICVQIYIHRQRTQHLSFNCQGIACFPELSPIPESGAAHFKSLSEVASGARASSSLASLPLLVPSVSAASDSPLLRFFQPGPRAVSPPCAPHVYLPSSMPVCWKVRFLWNRARNGNHKPA